MSDAELESLLADRPRAEPPADLGPRVLAAVSDVVRHRPTSRWRSWAAVAAAVLLAINLSMSVSTNTHWRLAADVDPGRVAATTDELRALDLDLPEAELRRQALLTHAGAGLAPTAPLSPNRTRTSEEPDRWDVR